MFKSFPKPKIRTLVISATMLLALSSTAGAAIYFYSKYQKLTQNPELITKQEVTQVTQTISQFMELPSDEEPTIATVTDKEKLQSQEFFKKAENGDKIVIYVKARKALLFRPSTGKVIEFAPLAIDANANEQSDAGTNPAGLAKVAEKTSVAIYNGTQVPGLTAVLEKKLSSAFSVEVVAKQNAQKNDHKQSLVIDLDGTLRETAEQIAKEINGKVATSLPDGESKPNAGILIIAGQE